MINNQVPADIRKSLKTFIAKPSSDYIKYTDKLPHSIESALDDNEKLTLTVRETAGDALNNILTLLRLIDGGKIKISQNTGRPTAATAKKLTGLLKGGDWYEKSDISDQEVGPIQGFAWPIIMQGGGLATIEGSTLRLSNAGKKALNGNLPDVIKTVWKRWEKTKIIDEFSRIDVIKGQKSSRGRTLTAASTRRPVINEALRHCIPDKWISLDELSRYMNSKGLEFQVARNIWKLYICDPQYGYLDEYESSSLIEERYLLVYLFEYAATLGLIDVAYTHPAGTRSDYYECWGADDMDFLSRYDGLIYIRINSLGAYVLGMTEKYEAPTIEPVSVLKVLPNHEIVITDATTLSPSDTLFLEKTCKKISESLWRITLQSLLKAAQESTVPDEFYQFLKSRSSVPVPQTVMSLINDAKKRSTLLKYSGRAHLIECKDLIIIQLILSDKKLSKICLAAGDKFLIVLPGKENAFLKALADMGYIVSQFKEQI